MAIADLAADMARALDPVRLAAQGGFAPDPWQCDVLRSMAPVFCCYAAVRPANPPSPASWACKAKHTTQRHLRAVGTA